MEKVKIETPETGQHGKVRRMDNGKLLAEGLVVVDGEFVTLYDPTLHVPLEELLAQFDLEAEEPPHFLGLKVNIKTGELFTLVI